MIYKGIELITIKLTNGLIVGNFSSNHPFNFVDGNVLPAVSDIVCKHLTSTDVVEEVIANNGTYKTIEVKFNLNNNIGERLDLWRKAWNDKKVDVVILPLPVLIAYKEKYSHLATCYSPFRTGRIADRVTKQLHIDKFCI